MKYGYRTGSILGENVNANNATKDFNKWKSRRMVMCWSCQKDKYQNEGVFSFMIKRTTGKLTSGTAPKKFVCFACKPQP